MLNFNGLLISLLNYNHCICEGAGNGIGRAVALKLASRGAGIALIDKDAEAMAKTRDDCVKVSPGALVVRFQSSAIKLFGN